MPNFHTTTLKHLVYPCSHKETVFHFEATSSRGNTLIMTTTDEQQLFLRIHQKAQGGYLIKGDKVTRPTEAQFLQKTLVNFRDIACEDVSHSNIEPKKFLQAKHSAYLKEIDFFANAFHTMQEIWIEIGFGSGRHLLHQAKKNPHIQFIGLEIHKPSIAQVLKQCELQGITNILVLDYDARLFMEFLASNSVGRIFVHFPVPWDKKPHRRVFSEAFIEEAMRVLIPQGTLELRTDSQLYFEFAFGIIMQLSKANVHVHKNAQLEISSKYEDRWRKMDKDIYDIILTNETHSPSISKMPTLDFEKWIDFAIVQRNFKEENIRGDGFFLHFEELFDINDKSGLIRLSMGANERNEKVYVWIQEDGKVVYLPTILATKNNVAAHNLMKEWFDGIRH